MLCSAGCSKDLFFFFSEKNGKSRKGLSRGEVQPNVCFTMIILDAMSGIG